jgi:uncharacterized membrane protein YozB (DUF420 family)
MTTLLKTTRVVGAVLALAVVAYALTYLRPGMPSGFEEQLDVYRSRAFWLLLHICGAAVALALAPFQLWSGPRALARRGDDRQRLRRAHRLGGRVSAAAVLVGATGGLALAWTSYGGPSNTVGFGTLAIAWAGCVVLAVRTARRGDLARHRAWALRAAALTFAAVTLRLWLPALSGVVGFEAAYAVIGWLCWVPNLLFVEWWLRRSPAGRSATQDLQRRRPTAVA